MPRKGEFQPIDERLARYSLPTPSGCVLWLGSLDRKGYGEIWYDGRKRSAHVVSYERKKGPVPDGMELDHQCKVPFCISDAHLEPVTHKENVRRGISGRIRKLFCDDCGAPYETLWLRRSGRPHRGCRACRNAYQQQQRDVHGT